MFGPRGGRGGSSRQTSSNVQCQKCLKRGHYSYECKANAQERPYVSRPSRSQQLRNPKLVPKLDSDTINPLERKKGLADEELAKREEERARQEELKRRDDEVLGRSPRSRRSNSPESVSSYSTADSRESQSSRRGNSVSPPQHAKDPPPPRQRSYSRSLSPPRRRQRRSWSRDSRSPVREPSPERSYRRRDSISARNSPKRGSPGRRPDFRVGGPGRQKHSFSRSPEPERRRDNRRDLGWDQANTTRKPAQERYPSRSPPPRAESARERSLSPFSKRVAISRAANAGRPS